MTNPFGSSSQYQPDVYRSSEVIVISASSLQATGDVAAIMTATQPVDTPGKKMTVATQPVEAPGARIGTEPVEAPGARSEVLSQPTGSVDVRPVG